MSQIGPVVSHCLPEKVAEIHFLFPPHCHTPLLYPRAAQSDKDVSSGVCVCSLRWTITRCIEPRLFSGALPTLKPAFTAACTAATESSAEA